ncbi:MAG: L-seryl-tRNA(Sec) selenium transferase [Syntrophorhabdales bacterium]
MNSLLRKIPKVDEVLKHEQWQRLLGNYSQETAKDALRAVLEELRLNIKEGKVTSLPPVERIIEETGRHAAELSSSSLRKVINGTGVVVHTNLGRSLLAKPAIDALVSIASNYSNLEYDLKRGKRGDRYEHCASVLQRLTGAEASLVVNNNAAAVLLVLDTFAQGKEVVIARGELIEIGGSFRIPDVMRKSGAILREVGTTNRTFSQDYERAVNENTGLLMKAHTSNYRIRGFVHETPIAELVELGKRYRVPVFYDAGSGLLYPLKRDGAFDEPVIADFAETGLDMISFSADKLLGGPQAGIILGKTVYIDAMKKNPLTRAIRPDKFTLAALEATLFLFADQEQRSQIPTLEMIYQDETSLKRKASRLAAALRKRSSHLSVSVVSLASEVGGGSLPDVALPSYGLALEPRSMSLVAFEEKLRKLETPIIARIGHDRLLIDMRTIRKADEPLLISGIAAALADGT